MFGPVGTCVKLIVFKKTCSTTPKIVSFVNSTNHVTDSVRLRIIYIDSDISN